MNEHAYVIESPAFDNLGARVGTFRHYVATEARAREEAAKHPERTWRVVAVADMRPEARENIERALRGG